MHSNTADYPLDYRKSVFLYKRSLSLFVGSALSQSSREKQIIQNEKILKLMDV